MGDNDTKVIPRYISDVMGIKQKVLYAIITIDDDFIYGVQESNWAQDSHMHAVKCFDINSKKENVQYKNVTYRGVSKELYHLCNPLDPGIIDDDLWSFVIYTADIVEVAS